MPWSIVAGHSGCSKGQWAVVKDDDGSVAGCHDTETAAREQQEALFASERSTSRQPVEFRNAQVHSVDFTERVIQLIAVPYGEETVVADHDGRPLREVVERGSFRGIETRSDHVTVNRDHDYGRTVGKAVSYRTDDPAGLVADLYVSDTDLGNETLRLASDGVLKASVAMVVRRSDQTIRKGLRRIHRAFLDHIALVPNPSYKGARVLAVRQERELPAAGEDQPPTPNLDAIQNELGEFLDRLRDGRR